MQVKTVGFSCSRNEDLLEWGWWEKRRDGSNPLRTGCLVCVLPASTAIVSDRAALCDGTFSDCGDGSTICAPNRLVTHMPADTRNVAKGNQRMQHWFNFTLIKYLNLSSQSRHTETISLEYDFKCLRIQELWKKYS